MEIMFFSDYVCPYCLVAKTALQKAIAELEGGDKIKLEYLPFELTPPPAERVDTYHDETRREHYRVLEEPCLQLGLDMKLPPHVVPRPYTNLAFQGYYFAGEHGKEAAYNSEVYEAYFIREEDIGDPEVLCRLAKKVGLDAGLFRQALKQGTYKEQLQEANRYARQEKKIQHVPTIFIDGREVTAEAYTVDAYLKLLKNHGSDDAAETDSPAELREASEAVDAARPNETPEAEHTPHGHVCGPDGCRLF